MLRNRKITVTVDKKTDQDQETHIDPKAFEKKAEVILNKLERIGKKVFLGVCIYVIIDTHRQVAVERAKFQ